jgi:hypothetical protein
MLSVLAYAVCFHSLVQILILKIPFSSPHSLTIFLITLGIVAFFVYTSSDALSLDRKSNRRSYLFIGFACALYGLEAVFHRDSLVSRRPLAIMVAGTLGILSIMLTAKVLQLRRGRIW